MRLQVGSKGLSLLGVSRAGVRFCTGAVAEALRDNVVGSTAAEPELLAHHFTQAGLIEAAIEWWGKAGQWSLARSALADATAKFSRALAQIATLPATPALGREQIKFHKQICSKWPSTIALRARNARRIDTPRGDPLPGHYVIPSTKTNIDRQLEETNNGNMGKMHR